MAYERQISFPRVRASIGELRTTLKTPIYIIGGGIIGLLTAYELVAAAEKVVVIDHQSIGQEASWAGGGILSPLYPWRYPEPVEQLARWSQSHYQDLAETLRVETGIDTQWIRSGLLIIDENDTDTGFNWCRTHSIVADLVDQKGMTHLEPHVRMRSNSALNLPDVAQIRNPRFLKALVAWLRAHGVEIRENVAAKSLEVRAGALTAIHTDSGPINVERAIVAAGAWSGALLATAEVQVPVMPIKGQMLLLRGSAAAPFNHILLREACYLIPRQDGRVLVGSSQEESGFDKSTTESVRVMLYGKAVDLVPSLREWQIERQWAGLRPGSPDGIPYIGSHPEIKGLYVNTGHFRNGIVLAPASARLAADLVLGRTPFLDLRQFRILRK